MRRVLYVQFTDPAVYPPLEHSAKLLAKQGWNIVFLGVGTVHPFEFSEVPGVKSYRMNFVKRGWAQKVQYLVFFLWTFGWVLRWRPKWIYASDPLSCPIAWWVRKLTGVRVLYHEHDSPGLSTTGSGFMNRVLRYRRELGRNAELCVLPQRERLREFVKNIGRRKPTFCVWNCPSAEECGERSSSAEHASFDKGRGLIAYYHGSINADRLPIELIAAASRFGGAVRLRIAGYETLGGAGYLRRMGEAAESMGVGDLIEHFGTLSRRSDVMDVASNADVGIALMPKRSDDINMKHMVGASNKPFDYMACGLPLLVTGSAEWIDAFVKPGFARACDPDDENSIEAAFKWFLDHPGERLNMGSRGREHIRQTWNYERMFAPVLAAMESD